MNETQIIPAGEETRLLSDTVMPGANANELRFFAQVCNRMGLDPFRREIHPVKRRVRDGDAYVERWVFQVGIDGYRKRAAATGRYAGSDECTTPEDEKFPRIATATVYRLVDGHRVAFTAKARWDEYVQTDRNGNPMGLWAKMPHTMLSKCAEAKALRKAFPDELAGTYTEEEMAQADGFPATPAKPAEQTDTRSRLAAAIAKPAAPSDPKSRVEARMQESGVSAQELDDALSQLYGEDTEWTGLDERAMVRLASDAGWTKVMALVEEVRA